MKQEPYQIPFFKGLDPRPDARDPQTLTEMVNVEVTDQGSLRLFRGARLEKVLNDPQDRIPLMLDYPLDEGSTETILFTGMGHVYDLRDQYDFSQVRIPPTGGKGALWGDLLDFYGRKEVVLATAPPTRVFLSSSSGESEDNAIGVSSPNEEWAAPTEHAIWIDPILGVRRHPSEFEPLEDPPGSLRWGYRIPLLSGRAYRWSWYDPSTGHDSSLQTLYGVKSIAQGSLDTPYVSEIALAFNGEAPDHEPLPYPSQGGDHYSHVRIWATPDGQENFYLIPRLYDIHGNLITDKHGAIPITLIHTLSETNKEIIEESFVNFNISLFYDGWNTAAPFWNQVDEQSTPDPQGTILHVKGASEEQPQGYFRTPSDNPPTHPDAFRLKGSDHLFRIVYAEDLSVDENPPYEYRLYLDTPLSDAFPDGVLGKDGLALEPLWYSPITDMELRNSLLWIDGDEGHNPPPPHPQWGAIFGQRLWFAQDDKLYYSIPGQYEDFPKENHLKFQEPILGLAPAQMIGAVSEGLNQRLLIGTRKRIEQLILLAQGGSDFALRPYLSSTGIMGPRSWAVSNGILYAITDRGLEILDEQRQIWVGESVTPIVPDGVSGLHSNVAHPILFNANSMGLITIYRGKEHLWNPALVGPNDFLVMKPYVKGQPPIFSHFQGTAMGNRGPVTSIYMSNTEDREKVLAAYGNGTVWSLFSENPVYGYPTEDPESPLVGEGMVRSQLLDMKAPGLTKVFYEVWAEDDILGCVRPGIRFSVDKGFSWTNWHPIETKHPIGLIGDTLLFELRFTPLTLVGQSLKSLIFVYAVAGRGQSRYVWRKK